MRAEALVMIELSKKKLADFLRDITETNPKETLFLSTIVTNIKKEIETDGHGPLPLSPSDMNDSYRNIAIAPAELKKKILAVKQAAIQGKQ